MDAANGKSGAAVTLVVDSQDAPVLAATIRSSNTETAGELAIALLWVETEAHFKISDSKVAVRNFRKDTISLDVTRVPFGTRPNRKISL